MKTPLQYLSTARTALNNGYEQRANFYEKIAEHISLLSIGRTHNSKIEVNLSRRESKEFRSLRGFLRRMQR